MNIGDKGWVTLYNISLKALIVLLISKGQIFTIEKHNTNDDGRNIYQFCVPVGYDPTNPSVQMHYMNDMHSRIEESKRQRLRESMLYYDMDKQMVTAISHKWKKFIEEIITNNKSASSSTSIVKVNQL